MVKHTNLTWWDLKPYPYHFFPNGRTHSYGKKRVDRFGGQTHHCYQKYQFWSGYTETQPRILQTNTAVFLNVSIYAE